MEDDEMQNIINKRVCNSVLINELNENNNESSNSHVKLNINVNTSKSESTTTYKLNETNIKLIIRFLNIKEILLLLLTNYEINNIIQNSDIFQKYLNLRTEFTFPERNKNYAKINTLSYKLKEIKSSIREKEKEKKNKKIQNLTCNSTISNNNASYKTIKSVKIECPENKKEILKLDYDKINIGSLISNDIDKIKKLSKKYELTKNETLQIFIGLLENKTDKNIYTQIQKNKKLEIIYNNLKTNSGLLYIIYSYFNYESVNKIDLSGNNISYKGIKNNKIILNLLTNFIKKNMSSLKIVNISNNNIEDQGLKLLFNPLDMSNSKLSILNISQNNITSEGIIHLEYFLTNTTYLTVLNLEQNLIGSIGISLLSEYLANNQSLRTLNVAYNGLESKGITNMKNIISHKKLISLFLGGNYICDNGLECLANYLEEGSKISYLFLEDNNITSKSYKILLKLSQCPFLNSLNLRNNNISDDGFTKLISSIKKQSKLFSIDFSKNNITHKSLENICKIMESNTTVKNLVLNNNNKLGKAACKFFGNILEKNNSLVSLGLVNCDIGGGVNFIFEGLKKNKKLNLLDLSYNNLNNESFKSIIEGLKENKNLSELIMNNCKLGDAEVKILCSALANNNCIKNIKINNNSFSSDILEDIINDINKCEIIRNYEVEGNGFNLIELKELETTMVNKNKFKK